MAGVHAQVPTTETGARLSESFERLEPILAEPLGETLRLEGSAAPSGASAVTLEIRDIQVVGLTAYSLEELQARVDWPLGLRSIADIYTFAQDLTVVYQNDGFFLSRVIVPPQDLDPAGATIRLQVVEGYIDEVVWPESLIDRRGHFAEHAQRITSARPLSINTLERELLLIDDLPGITVETQLEPSQLNPGASRLIVTLESEIWSGVSSIDNYGTESRGPWRGSLRASAANVFGLHERLSFQLVGTTDWGELTYGSFNYEQILNSLGSTFSTEISYDSSVPGTAQLQALGYESQSISASVALRHAIVRSRERNLSVEAEFKLQDFSSESLGAALNEDRTRALRIALVFDQRDTWNGVTQVQLAYEHGLDVLGSTRNGQPLASRASGRVDYSLIEGAITRVQALPGSFSSVFRLVGQYAATPLLAGQECSYGGQSIGRGYRGSAVVGDHCISASAELRYNADTGLLDLDRLELFAFADHGRAWQVSTTATAGTHDFASSIGAGLRLSWNDHFTAEGLIGQTLGGSIPGREFNAFMSIGVRY